MYFLVVVALIAGQPQTMAGAFPTRKACEDKLPEVTQIIEADGSISAFSVHCIMAVQPIKRL